MEHKRYAAGDTVMYAAQGVCRVQGVEEKTFAGSRAEYYILQPVYAPQSTVYVPVDNAALTDKMRRLLSAEEVLRLIRSMPEESSAWVEDDGARKEAYREILAHGDHRELIRAVKAVYRRRQELQEKGRKLHAADERFFKEAEKMLYDEFALVLNLRPEEVLPFILDQIRQEGRRKAEEGSGTR